MAEGILAFGIAANVMQFIDFGCRILSSGYQIYKSDHGVSPRYQDLETVNTDLHLVTENLECTLKQEQSKQELSPNDLALQQLAGKCRDVCSELSAALEKLKVQGKPLEWNTFRAALMAVWKQSRIESLQKRLGEFRKEIIFRMLVTFRDQMTSSIAKQTSVLNKLEGIDVSNQGLGQQFLSYIKQSKKWQEGYLEECRKWQADLIAAIHKDKGAAQERRTFASRFETEREQRLQRNLLEHLHFPEMTDRHDRIAEAYEKTFQWIYRDPSLGFTSWKNFTEWLKSDSTLYWITGKAGSGKSTLMKYLYNDARTFKHLDAWASGTPLMSQKGLLRSILSQVLKKSPALIPRVFPRRWEVCSLFGHDHFPWGLLELQQAVKLLAQEDPLETRHCFFIDGLDEFDGDLTSLATFFKDISSYTHIKICVSSRPWVEFGDAFVSRPSLMLQDLTYPDIRHFINSHFHSHAGFMELEKREPEYAGQLFEAIAFKAAGVFLWVHLVVHSLLAGFANGDRISDLQRGLGFLPPDLKHLYEKMLKSLDPFYLEHASQYFQPVRASEEPPTLLCLSFADEEPEFFQNCKVQPLEDPEKLLRADIMRRRLNSRCKGLLEVASHLPLFENTASALTISSPTAQDTQRVAAMRSSPADSTVQYLHRTVKDFLETPEVWNRLLAATRGCYNPYLALCKSFIVQLKTLPPGSLSQEGFWYIVKRCLHYAYTVQENNSEPHISRNLVAMLDELDRAATELANNDSGDGSTFSKRYGLGALQSRGLVLEYNWTTTFPHHYRDFISLHSSGRTFLSLAVKLDLHSYVIAKASKNCLVKQDTGIWPLLNDAITFNGASDKFFQKHPFPSLKMVMILLERGADPIWPMSTGTVWQRLIFNVSLAERMKNNISQTEVFQTQSLDGISKFVP